MPELPEVETIARTLHPLIQGRRIVNIHTFLSRSVQGNLPLDLSLGHTISHVGRRGKLVLIHINSPQSISCATHSAAIGSTIPDNKDAHAIHKNAIQAHGEAPCFLAIHLKMTGKLFVYGPQEPPGPHTRIIWDLEGPRGAERLFFEDARTFGYVRLCSEDSLKQWGFWQSLGLEPLETPVNTLVSRMQNKKGRIKAVLLDQTVVAGIGNIYADESLFRAGIHPCALTHHLSQGQLVKLWQCVCEVLQESIDQCGSSIRDYRTARGDAGAFQNTFRVYGRSGQICYTCSHPLTTLKVAGRTTVVCELCQKK